VTSEPAEPQGSDIPPEEPARSTPPRLLPRWLWGLSGIGLFLAGAILGAVLMASVTLYQLPVAPVAPTVRVTTPAAPAATLPVLRTIAPTARPTPTRPPVGPGIGQRAPAFVLSGLDGITYTLSAYAGQTVVLNFWASWCPPCREEWPELLAFAAGLTNTGVVFLSANVEELPEIVWGFVGTETLSFPVLLDPDGQVGERYHVTVLPTTFVIDAAGLVRHVLPGPMEAAILQGLVQP
jgi:thiol-disulfide isomerase/thioredoxin